MMTAALQRDVLLAADTLCCNNYIYYLQHTPSMKQYHRKLSMHVLTMRSSLEEQPYLQSSCQAPYFLGRGSPTKILFPAECI